MTGQPARAQLDEISAKIGELTAYTHEHRHGVANISMKLDGLRVEIARDIAALDGKMSARIAQVEQALDQRLKALETKEIRREGAAGIVAYIVRSPVVGWVVLAAAGLWGFLTGKIHP